MSRLIDLAGRPLTQISQGIPILQHARGLPSRGVYVRRPSEIEAAAELFISQGGRYRVALLDDGLARFAACVGSGDDIFEVG